MQLTPEEISTYTYCPLLYYKGKVEKLYPRLNTFEMFLKDSFVAAEENALLLNSAVNTNKLISAWDKIWWPLAIKNKVSTEIAEKKTLLASQKFIEYCRYEFSSYTWPTIGVNIENKIPIGNSILNVKTDLIKINLEAKKKNTVLINFTNRDLSIRDAAFDNAIRIKCYGFYSGRGETISHININISEKKNLKMSLTTIQPKDIIHIEKMIKGIEKNMYNKVSYMNSFACEQCKECAKGKLNGTSRI